MSIDIIITEPPIINENTDPSSTNEAMAFIENITSKVDGVFSWTMNVYGGFQTAHFEMVVPEGIRKRGTV